MIIVTTSTVIEGLTITLARVSTIYSYNSKADASEVKKNNEGQ